MNTCRGGQESGTACQKTCHVTYQH